MFKIYLNLQKLKTNKCRTIFFTKKSSKIKDFKKCNKDPKQLNFGDFII